MVPASRVALCLLVVCTVAWCQPDKASSSSEYAWVGGAVLDRGTGAPLSKALVTLSTEEAEPLEAQALTDGDGRFVFAKVPPGRYQLQAYCAGHAGAYYGAETRNHAGGIVTLRAGERRQELVLRLEALSSVSGVVTDGEGDPLPGVSVTLLMQAYSRGKPLFGSRAVAETDDRGAYRIHDIYPGRYVAMANGRDHQAFRMQPEASMDKQPPEQAKFGVQFYPGTNRLSSAAILALGSGKEIRGIDFRLSAAVSATLRGTVILPEEWQDDSWPRVTIIPLDLPEPNQGTFGFPVPPPLCTFEQYGMTPGEYQVVTNLSVGDRRYRGVQRVSMNEGAEREVKLQLEAGVDLPGSLRVEGGSADSLRDYEVELIAGDAIPLDDPPPAARVKADGSFVLKSVVPGTWDIGVKPIPPGGYIKSMWLGDQDVLTEDMIIGPRTAAPLRIVVSTRGGVLEGNVGRGSGEDAARAIVLLAPTGKFSHVLSLYTTAVADETGRFKLKGLTPGGYKLYAFEAMENGAWENPEFLKPFDSFGEKVEIAEGANASKKIQLIPGTRNQR